MADVDSGRVARRRRRRHLPTFTEFAIRSTSSDAPPQTTSCASLARLWAGGAGSCIADQWDAAEDLLELERSGLRVSFPAQPCSPAAAGPVTTGLAAPARTAERSDLGLGADPEVVAALNELEELSRCGLSVRWP